MIDAVVGRLRDEGWAIANDGVAAAHDGVVDGDGAVPAKVADAVSRASAKMRSDMIVSLLTGR